MCLRKVKCLEKKGKFILLPLRVLFATNVNTLMKYFFRFSVSLLSSKTWILICSHCVVHIYTAQLADLVIRASYTMHIDKTSIFCSQPSSIQHFFSLQETNIIKRMSGYPYFVAAAAALGFKTKSGFSLKVKPSYVVVAANKSNQTQHITQPSSQSPELNTYAQSTIGKGIASKKLICFICTVAHNSRTYVVRMEKRKKVQNKTWKGIPIFSQLGRG